MHKDNDTKNIAATATEGVHSLLTLALTPTQADTVEDALLTYRQAIAPKCRAVAGILRQIRTGGIQPAPLESEQTEATEQPCDTTPNPYADTTQEDFGYVSAVEGELLAWIREGIVPVPPRPEDLANDPAMVGYLDPADATPEAGERERALWRAALRELADRALEFAELVAEL